MKIYKAVVKLIEEDPDTKEQRVVDEELVFSDMIGDWRAGNIFEKIVGYGRRAYEEEFAIGPVMERS